MAVDVATGSVVVCFDLVDAFFCLVVSCWLTRFGPLGGSCSTFSVPFVGEGCVVACFAEVSGLVDAVEGFVGSLEVLGLSSLLALGWFCFVLVV